MCSSNADFTLSFSKQLTIIDGDTSVPLRPVAPADKLATVQGNDEGRCDMHNWPGVSYPVLWHNFVPAHEESLQGH